MSAPENEKAAVRTTIGDSGPPRGGRHAGTIPRGIEVLVKKAAVDPEFRELLFKQRGAAAAAIELELDPAENAMLNAIPREQLAQIVSQTTVPLEQRRVFLGRLAVAMLAVLGAGITGCDSKSEPQVVQPNATDGIRPDRPKNIPPTHPPAPAGIRPGLPATNAPATKKPPSSPTRGIQPDRPKSDATNPPPPVMGIQPDRP
jgi:hypothetical protein